MNNALVFVDNAAFGYSRKGMPVVEGARFSAGSGDFIVLQGPNGCGKSTIIKGMLGIANLVKGSVSWNVDKTRIGYVPQETTISSGIPYTVLDIVTCGVAASRKKNAKDDAMNALAAVEMETGYRVRFGDLSGGQKRRVLFARALVREPRILLLDEPTANVDVHTEKIIVQLIGDITSRRKAAVIAVAHATDFAGIARVLRVEDGRCHE